MENDTIQLLLVSLQTCFCKQQRQYKYLRYSHANFAPGVNQGNRDVRLAQDFISLFLCLVIIKRIRRQDESRIPLRSPSGGKLLLRPSAGCNKLLGRVVLRILSNIQDEALLQKQATAIRS